jgi:hypothetical protein
LNYGKSKSPHASWNAVYENPPFLAPPLRPTFIIENNKVGTKAIL